MVRERMGRGGRIGRRRKKWVKEEGMGEGRRNRRC